MKNLRKLGKYGPEIMPVGIGEPRRYHYRIREPPQHPLNRTSNPPQAQLGVSLSCPTWYMCPKLTIPV